MRCWPQGDGLESGALIDARIDEAFERGMRQTLKLDL
jgi:hypothetical protein